MTTVHVRVYCVVVFFHHCRHWGHGSARRSCADCELTVPFVSAHKRKGGFIIAYLICSVVKRVADEVVVETQKHQWLCQNQDLFFVWFLHCEMKTCRMWVLFLVFSCSCDPWEPPLEAAVGRCTSMSLTPSRKASSGQHRYCLWSSHSLVSKVQCGIFGLI